MSSTCSGSHGSPRSPRGRVLGATALLALILARAPAGERLVPYAPYLPRNDAYLSWTARWPTTADDAGYPLLPGAEIIELTDGAYGHVNNHAALALLDGHLFAGHNNHRFAMENLSGQRCLGWIHRIGDPWRRDAWNGPQAGAALELFPPPDRMSETKFDGTRFMGSPEVGKLPSGDLFVWAQVATITRGTELRPTGIVNTWHIICTLARPITTAGALGPIAVVAVRRADLLAQARSQGFLRHPDEPDGPCGRALRGVEEAGMPRLPVRGKPMVGDGRTVCEFTTTALDEAGARLLAVGRADNGQRTYRHYVSVSEDSGRTWSPVQPTNIPTAENRSSIHRLPDGRLMLVGTLADRNQASRRPLSLALADDGRRFNHVYRLDDGRERHHIHGALLHGGFLYLAGGHRSNGDHVQADNGGRGEFFALRLALDRLPPPLTRAGAD